MMIGFGTYMGPVGPTIPPGVVGPPRNGIGSQPHGVMIKMPRHAIGPGLAGRGDSELKATSLPLPPQDPPVPGLTTGVTMELGQGVPPFSPVFWQVGLVLQLVGPPGEINDVLLSQ
jgi:hypothetical protein